MNMMPMISQKVAPISRNCDMTMPAMKQYTTTMPMRSRFSFRRFVNFFVSLVCSLTVFSTLVQNP